MLEQESVTRVSIESRMLQERCERSAVDEARARDLRELSEGWREVDVADQRAARPALWYTRTAHDERHPDVAVVRRFLTGRHPEFAEMKAIVGAEHEVRIRE